ncbi:MAG: hypothetical protein WDN01_22240 [Rhizomicrobium sp.]
MSGPRISACIAACMVLALSACASPQDTVVFVTNTSLGVNVENQPPSASVAYDRTEGYVGPRTANGGLPPVVASLQTGGDVFDPKVRQTYATGAAAEIAADPGSGAHGPSDLEGPSADNRMAFFGTSTTIGLKVGFDTSAVPNSLVFGFKRKELSIIPLGTDGTKRVYPSVLASVDTTVAATTLKGTGLTIAQYFATGLAAESLARNSPTVHAAFSTITNNAMLATLTPDQQKQAQTDANNALQTQSIDLNTVMSYVAPGGVLDPAKLTTLIQKANAASPGSVNPALATGLSGAADLRKRLAGDLATTGSLARAASS